MKVITKHKPKSGQIDLITFWREITYPTDWFTGTILSENTLLALFFSLL